MQSSADRERLRVVVRGAVQGVGFRPFVYRLASELALAGWVANGPQGVVLEVEGAGRALHDFLLRVEAERPPRAAIHGLEYAFLPPLDLRGFVIRESNGAGARTALVLPDIATCADCLREVCDPRDRRHGYPFTNCTNCGPRFSIIRGLPYDRAQTTMAGYTMCAACRREYEDPGDRRFHAQPNACPACGPQLALWDSAGAVAATRGEALRRAVEAVRGGEIVAVKGVGGFHLVVAAADEDAVRRLRARKHREAKPLAVMAPSPGWVRGACEVSALEARLLAAPEAPIVLLRRRAGAREVAAAVAPGNPWLGVMLPYTPLHHLLLRGLGGPVVATSGNLADEPICTEEQEALHRLSGVADRFLVHDRPIARHVDDSVVRVLLGRELVLRRARGYAPLPVHVARRLPPLLGLGAHLKNAVALGLGQDVFVGQHVGDLETVPARAAFRAAARDLCGLYGIEPAVVACDLHPDYASTREARAAGRPVQAVQHHLAHVLACLAENQVHGPALGVAWDGAGYGQDGTVWGGEFLRVRDGAWERVAHLRAFSLPGGDAAAAEPRRAGLGLLYEIFGEALFGRDDVPLLDAFRPAEREVVRQALRRRINCPRTTSAGRLFDAVAAILGLRHGRQFEGQAAMELEWAIGRHATDEVYPFRLRGEESPLVLDWEPMIRAVLGARRLPVAATAARVHNTLAEMVLAVARRAGERAIALTGGCFQNVYLTERVVARLRADGFTPYWHQRIPPNDGGIALGQVVAAATGSTSDVPGDPR
jgi:hydrogenase maturation protein HypF